MTHHLCDDPEIDPCVSCLDEITNRLDFLKREKKVILNPDLLDEIVLLVHYVIIKKNDCDEKICGICRDHHCTLSSSFDEVRWICRCCEDEILQRAILLYDRDRTIRENLDTALYCYVIKRLGVSPLIIKEATSSG